MNRRRLLLTSAFLLLSVSSGRFVYWLSKPRNRIARSKLMPLASANAFAEEYKEAAQVVAASLVVRGDKAEDFYAEVEPKGEGRILVFHLWHVSAFEPRNQNVVGNPGGKCRDVEYDVMQRKVVQTLFWQ